MTEMNWLVFLVAVVVVVSVDDVFASMRSPNVNLVLRMSRESKCPLEVTCDGVDTTYRTADGSCNNLQNPDFGKVFTRLERLENNTYDDGIGAFRTISTNGFPLPNVRNISVTIMKDANKTDPEFTLSVMQWSQLMDHDLAHVPFTTLEDGETIDCCPTDGSSLHPSCRPIDVSGDTFYSQFGVTCMSFTRSVLARGFGENCIFRTSEQVNQITHWMDGSNVYGSTKEEQDYLRKNESGLLRTSSSDLLPINPDQGGECEGEVNDALCYLAGDSRANEQPGLTAIHILFLREHNRIATELQGLNQDWDDELLFQETRRLVVAVMQNIAYTEWLPIIVGETNMERFGLQIPENNFTDDYDETINPNMLNEFAAAAFRYGHSLVPGMISLFSADGTLSTIQLRDNFNSPHEIQNEERLDDIIRGLFMSKEQKYDSCITEDLTQHLFQPHNEKFGMDLVSINLQRGRDHGIATYNTMRERCGLTRAQDFDDLIGEIDPNLIKELKTVYDHVDDIDLFTGGVAENSLDDALLGPTFACIVSIQFERLKKGDRFFYSLGGRNTSFTRQQLREIRRSTWAKIICENSNVETIQRQAFRTEGPGNPKELCGNITGIDLRRWRRRAATS